MLLDRKIDEDSKNVRKRHFLTSNGFDKQFSLLLSNCVQKLQKSGFRKVFCSIHDSDHKTA